MYIEVWDYVLLNVVLWSSILVTCYYDTKRVCPDKIDFKNKTVLVNIFIAILVTVAAVLILTIHIPNRSKILNEVCEDRMASKIYKE